MQMKPLVAASLVAFASLSSHAAATNWGVHDALEPGGAFSPAGFIDDTYKFTLGSIFVVSSSVYSLFGTIAPASYSIFSVGGDNIIGTADDMGLYAYTFSTAPTVHSVVLGAGNYYYAVFGKSMAPTAYAISSAIAPVPEPETYAMLLAGLGVIGFLARRRRIG